MAEAKYDLLLVDTKRNKKIYQQPWYKERLRTKYIKSLKPEDTSKVLIGRNWTFMKDGLDDFRDGLPPPLPKGCMIQGNKGLAPNINGSSDDLKNIKQPAARRRFNKHEICYSRVTPLQQQRRDHIEEIEYGLTQHPLALYPHLEECLPPDLFEDVVDILDPEMNLASDEEDEEGTYFRELDNDPESRTDSSHPVLTVPEKESPKDEEAKDDNSSHGSIDSSRFSLRSTSLDFSRITRVQSTVDPSRLEEPKVRNPYRWLPKKEEKDKKDKKKAAERRNQSPSEDAHIKNVTKDFCDWVSGLGGESNNIEESTITSLFASVYETKPALSVPIHVVELTNVPPELRMSANVPPAQSQTKKTPDESKSKLLGKGQYEPSWVKFRYGAWYLKPQTWKKMNADEPLKDPNDLKEDQMSEAKKKSTNLDYDLAPMHGAKSFMDFIEKKNTRGPEFLNRVKEIQEEQAAEEQARIEAELAKQKKLALKKRNESASSSDKK